ncbi:hypothetical protein PENSPDRAFT_583188 [Peniophora sp. CONT]|nr:hypothetical protein PENSPDRAFT_583188 [Peniophora sp. CONT]
MRLVSLRFLFVATVPSVLSALVQPEHVQVPLQLVNGYRELDWDTEPNANATGHLLFNSVSSLMQRWPNTVVRPGHSIVPCIIPAGTVLYHGLPSSTIPTHPDWLAFDFEHAFNFARGQDGHVLSFATTRPLRLVYFDGSSAAKVADGAYDTQEIVMYQEVRDDGRLGWGEDVRIKNLCEWGVPRGIDGFVRMEFHFEVMQCNFTSGLELISAINVLPHNDPKPWHTVPPKRDAPKLHFSQDNEPRPPRRGPGGPSKPTPPGWRGSLPSTGSEARVAGKWHDRAPGETRVQIKYDKLITFYDPAVTSLIDLRLGKPREQHRLKGISLQDARMKARELEEAIQVWDDSARSGIDWGSMTRVVVERYSQRLELLAYTLFNASFSDPRERATKARAQVLTMLAPYFTTFDSPRDDDAAAGKAWLAPVVQRCADTHTAGIPTSLLTAQERLIYDAVEDVMREICRRLGRTFHAAFDVENVEMEEKIVGSVVSFMKAEVNALMEWLDWTAVWLKCRPECSIEEMCIVPTWPFGRDEDKDDTRHPRCVRMPNV